MEYIQLTKEESKQLKTLYYGYDTCIDLISNYIEKQQDFLNSIVYAKLIASAIIKKQELEDMKKELEQKYEMEPGVHWEADFINCRLNLK